MAQGTYELRIYNPAGALQYIINDMLAFQYRKEVNAPGMLVFSVPDSHDAVGNLDQDWQVEVWRSRAADSGESNAVAPYADFYAFVRDEERSTNADGQTTVTFYCPGQMDFLRRSIVGYAAGVSNRSEFVTVAAETIAKTLITRNATTAGTTADGRDRTVPAWGTYISVESDAGYGPTMDFYCSRRNLLEVLQEIARIGLGDFDLVKTAARAWEYRWYNGRLGEDRADTVIFALQYGNMANPVLRRNRLSEATVAIVAGQGTEIYRAVEVRTGTNYDASLNSSEIYVDARDVSTASGLQARGDARLDEVEAKQELRFDVIQTPGSLYGVHYFLGDLVTGYYQGITETKQITAVTLSLQASGEEIIQVELQTKPRFAISESETVSVTESVSVSVS